MSDGATMETVKPKPRKVRLGAVEGETGDDKVIGLQAQRVDGEAAEVAEAAPAAVGVAHAAAPSAPWGPSPLVTYWLAESSGRLVPYPAVLCHRNMDDPATFDLVRFVAALPAALPVRRAAESAGPVNGCFTRP